MKKNIKTIITLLFISVLSLHAFVSSAQKKDTLPAMKMPQIDYKPSTTNGWVGQYVYEMHFDGKSSLKTTKGEVPYYRVKSDRIHTGYVEFPTEVRGAIRSNQPDKYNKERYESWIRSGSSQSWSKVVDTIKTILYTGSLGDIANTGTIETNYARNSNGSWNEGWLDGCDMQIDHTTGLYSFSIPGVSLEIDEDVWGIKTNFKPEKKETFQKKNKVRVSNNNVNYLQFGEWDEITGSFQKGQKEIVIRKRIPVLLQQTTRHGTKDIKLPAVNGYMDFYLVLRKMPFSEDKKNNSSASTQPVNSGTGEQISQNKNQATDDSQKKPVKKQGLGVLKNKVKNITGNN